ncbi:MAG: flagella basal body P-ring formation protein FlgA [Ramlibacter sp.]|nr:flagella basal body P-ring formation protein FlgA [Ramlibacter sp.]
MRNLSFPLGMPACWALLSCGAWASPVESQVIIEMRPQVSVQRAQVQLGEIAYIQTQDLPTIRRLVALPIGRAPRAGTDVVLQRDVLARWVRSQVGLTSDQVVWKGADETHVRSQAQELAASKVERAAREALQQWLAARASRYEIEMRDVPRDLSLPAGRVELKARPLAENAEPSSSMSVWLDVAVDGSVVRTLGVNFTVHAYRDGWVAPASVGRGVAISPDMVQKREVEITASTGAGTLGTDSRGAGAAPMRTTRALRSGEALTARNVAPAHLVTRGDRVDLHLKSGDVELQASGEAMEDGELGQTVKVRWGKASAAVPTRVVAPGRVEALL